MLKINDNEMNMLLEKKSIALYIICMLISANTSAVSTVLQMTAISHSPFHYYKSIECVSVRMFKISSAPSWFAIWMSAQTGRETHRASEINVPKEK